MKRLILLFALVSLACFGPVRVATATPAARLARRSPTLAAAGAPDVRRVCGTPWLHVRDARLGDVVGVLGEGDSVGVLAVSDGWARIGASRWVNAEYLCR